MESTEVFKMSAPVAGSLMHNRSILLGARFGFLEIRNVHSGLLLQRG